MKKRLKYKTLIFFFIFATCTRPNAYFSDAFLDNTTQLIIYNSLGKMIYQKNNLEYYEFINLEKYSNGIYYLKIIKQDKQYNEKIIKI